MSSSDKLKILCDENIPVKVTDLLNKKGFALLFSVLVSSLLLALSASILHINYKEFLLSGFGRESQKAFYVADMGSECALYWDVRHTGFAESPFATSTDQYPIECSGLLGIVVSRSNNISTFDATVIPGNYYMSVVVQKSYEDLSNPPDGIKEYLLTTINSRGSNVPPGVPSNKRVERGVKLQY